MRRAVRSAVLAVVVAGLSQPVGAVAQDTPVKPKAAGLEGIWEGPLKVGPIELRLAFKVTKDKGGTLAATMDSIDQGAKDIPAAETTFADRTLTVGFPKLRARFTGTLAADGDRIDGIWEQAGRTLPLRLERVEKPSTLNRPQHPRPPLPYRAEEVTFENHAAKVTLAGTLTLPLGDGPFPAVALVSGSGPQDRDETLLGHKPFLVLADHLTRNGVAVLRYDDRGVGKSKGTHDGATSADFATDAHAAVAYLRSRKEVDPKRVGLAGHSEGGLIAPMVAADHPDDVAFLVLLAGPGLPGDEVLRTQLEAILKAGGVPAETVAVSVRLQRAVVAAGRAPGTTTDERKKAIAAAGKAFIDGLSEVERKLIAGDAADPKAADAMAGQLADPWFAFFLAHDPRPVLKKVRCPVLAVNGEFDLQVLPEPNVAAVAKALKDGGNDRATTKVFPGLNHLFQPTKTGKVSEYGQIEVTFDPAALEFITAWVTKQK